MSWATGLKTCLFSHGYILFVMSFSAIIPFKAV